MLLHPIHMANASVLQGGFLKQKSASLLRAAQTQPLHPSAVHCPALLCRSDGGSRRWGRLGDGQRWAVGHDGQCGRVTRKHKRKLALTHHVTPIPRAHVGRDGVMDRVCELHCCVLRAESSHKRFLLLPAVIHPNEMRELQSASGTQPEVTASEDSGQRRVSRGDLKRNRYRVQQGKNVSSRFKHERERRGCMCT